MNFSNKTKGYFFVSLAGILSGTIVFGGKVLSTLGLSLFQVSILPYLLAALIIFPLAWRSGFVGVRNNLNLLLFYSFASGATVLCQFGGLVFGASVAVVVLLLYAQPLWTTLISLFFLKEKISKSQILACLLVLFGVVVLVNPFELGSSSLPGIICAVLGGVFLFLWVVLGSIASKRELSPFVIFFFGAFFGVIFTLLAYPLMLSLSSSPEVVGVSFSFSLWVYLAVVLFAIVSVIGGHLTYYAGAKHLPVITSGILMLLEPVVGVLLSVVFLAQPLTLPIVIGGALILFGNYLVIVKG